MNYRSSLLNNSATLCQALLTSFSPLQILIFHGCPGVTEHSRQVLENRVREAGHRIKQVTWTVY